MRRIAAQYLFTGKPPLLRHGMVTLNEAHRVIEVGQWDGRETAHTEFYNGVLAPGFVNAHCHLELSHLKGVVAPQAGMAGFLETVMKQSAGTAGVSALQLADEQMRKEGVVAVGDVCNTPASFGVKQESAIYYHSFIEVAGLSGQVTETRKATAAGLLKDAWAAGLAATVTPHAPYSMNEFLFAFAVEAAQRQCILSIHNQESGEENALFLQGKGALHTLFSSMGFTVPPPTGLTSVHRILPLLHESTRLLLVHNTVTSEADCEAVHAATRNVSWVLCPNSNRYITGMLPPAGLFFSKGAQVAIGTDSLASNTQLSVLEELKTLAQHFPQIPLETLLQWATYGGAQALRKERELGLLETGKRPGLALIENLDLHQLKLTADATSRTMIA
ncbi:MAG: amidohydrolase family protein [Prevotellaceae bacterium]|jgi:cytosine/adenosine deaminase-related metal-dependent hydrolase|nr:amidohydrolase family protein [Prevotellaceae bacterium]